MPAVWQCFSRWAGWCFTGVCSDAALQGVRPLVREFYDGKTGTGKTETKVLVCSALVETDSVLCKGIEREKIGVLKKCRR